MDTILPPVAPFGPHVRRKAPDAPDEARLWQVKGRSDRAGQDVPRVFDAMPGVRPEQQIGGRP
jgi:hypothetical protein